MIGVVQLASWAPSGLDHGGNMDFNAVQPGSTIHIRAQKPGGFLHLGDVHARMGDGELTGAGVEIVLCRHPQGGSIARISQQ